MSDEGNRHPKNTNTDFPERIAKVFALFVKKLPVYLGVTDEAEQEKPLWHSHAGVPFWEKWGAVPVAIMLYEFIKLKGTDEVKRLLAKGPFDFLFAYDAMAEKHPGLPRLPATFISALREKLGP